MKIKQLITGYLEQSMLLQLATSVDNIPWICTVCFAYDSEFNLYWFSHHNVRHSQEIARNPIVAGAVALPYSPGEKSQGLQLEGTASNLKDEVGIDLGLAVLQRRYDVKGQRTEQLRGELLSQSANYGLYRLRPSSIILHDKLHFPDSPRQVYTVFKDDPEKLMV